MSPIELTEAEFKLLEDPAERMRLVGDGPLTITGKLLGPPHRLDEVTLVDVHFVDCDFLGHYMFKVNLTRVTFTRCAIAGVRWEGGEWTDVTFTECVGRGRDISIIAGAGKGAMLYDKCQFIGREPPEPQYADDSELRGGIGAAGKCTFSNCEFTRMQIRLIGEADFRNCKFLSARIEPARFKVPIERVQLDNCNGTYTLDFSNRPINSLTLRNGSFHQIDLSDLTARRVVLENISGNFDLMRLRATSLQVSGCTFRSGTNELDKGSTAGLGAAFSQIDDITLVNSKFQGSRANLQAAGDPPEYDKDGKLIPRVSASKEVLPYLTEWGTVTIRNTPLQGADISYSRIKHLVLEDMTLSDTKIAHSAVTKLTLKNTTLTGTLDLSDTKIKEVLSEGGSRAGLKLVKDKSTAVEL